MRPLFFLAASSLCLMTAALFANGCAPDVTETDGRRLVDAGKDAKHDGATTSSGSSMSNGSSSGQGEADALPDYVDPGCPDAGPKITMFACDPYHQNNGDCLSGQACYIFVTYPTVACGQEIYGSTCAVVGSGIQGSPCSGAGDCGAGFVCVVSDSGTECVKLCPLQGDDGCPEGLVCGAIDVEGFGGCL